MSDQGNDDQGNEGSGRLSARVLVTDEDGRLLLFAFREGGSDAVAGWCTPGGGVEEGETLARAAARELREETGLTVPVEALGEPVAETSGYADLGWAAGVFRDVFFHCRVSAYEVDASGMEGLEREAYAGHRWWAVAELEGFVAAGGTVYPYGIASLVRELAAGRVPAEPVRLEWQH
ncbi:NUDIX hydrolase [Streptomyces sp. NPDC087440]|uniref:NUDIX hydrolase n=1 Tax=Streptomyces sp. NPDC087440 TaxID=3365790 RepID=UPI00380CCBEC